MPYDLKIILETMNSETDVLVTRDTIISKIICKPKQIEDFGLSYKEKQTILEKINNSVCISQVKLLNNNNGCPICDSELSNKKNNKTSNLANSSKHDNNNNKGYITLHQAAIEKAQAINIAHGLKDLYTIKHQKNVALLAKNIAKELMLSEERIKAIEIAALLHDIGKMCIPHDILYKKEKLSDIEFSLIKTHTEQGYDILKDIDFPWNIPEIVAQHHERFNGTGYPKGLKKNDILLETYILAVADVIDAMLADRPYRKGHNIKNVYNELVSNSNILYKNIVVKAFTKYLRRNT